MDTACEKCEKCESVDIFKIPAIQSNVTKAAVSTRPGKIVDEFIRDTKKMVQTEKNKMKKEQL